MLMHNNEDPKIEKILTTLQTNYATLNIKKIIKENNLDSFLTIQILYTESISLFNAKKYTKCEHTLNESFLLIEDIMETEILPKNDFLFLENLLYDFFKLNYQNIKKSEKVFNIKDYLHKCDNLMKRTFKTLPYSKTSYLKFLVEIEKITEKNDFLFGKILAEISEKNHLNLVEDYLFDNLNLCTNSNNEALINLNPLLCGFIFSRYDDEIVDKIINTFITTENLKEELQNLLNIFLKYKIKNLKKTKENDNLFRKILENLLKLKNVFSKEEIPLIENYVKLEIKLNLNTKLQENYLSENIKKEIIEFILKNKQKANSLKNLKDSKIYQNLFKNEWQIDFILNTHLENFEISKNILKKEKISNFQLLNLLKENNFLKIETLFAFFLGIENFQIIETLFENIKNYAESIECLNISLKFQNEEICLKLIENEFERLFQSEENLCNQNNNYAIMHILKIVKNNYALTFKILEKLKNIKKTDFLFNFIYNFIIDILENSINLNKNFIEKVLNFSINFLKSFDEKNFDYIEISLQSYYFLLENNMKVFITEILNLKEIYSFSVSNKIDKKRRGLCLIIFYAFFCKENIQSEMISCFTEIFEIFKISESTENLTKIIEIEKFYGCKNQKICYKILETLARNNLRKNLIDNLINDNLIEDNLIEDNLIKEYVECCLYFFISLSPEILLSFLKFIFDLSVKYEFQFKIYFNDKSTILIEKQIDFLFLIKNEFLGNKIADLLKKIK